MLDTLGTFVNVAGAVVAVGVGALLLYLLFKWRYKKVDTAHALVIYGRRSRKGKDGEVSREGWRILTGSGDFVKPLVEGYEVLDLRMMTLEIELTEVYTADHIPVNVRAIAQTKIGETDDLIYKAATGFLGDTQDDVKLAVRESVAGHLRSIIGQITAKELYGNQQAFRQKVRSEAEEDLQGMGVVFRSFTFARIDDDHGYYRALGEPEIAKAKRDARIADAEASKDATLREEEARQETEARKVQVQRHLAGETRELDLERAQIREEVDVAAARAEKAGEMEDTRRGTEIAEAQAERRRRELDAEVREVAEAERFAAEQAAEAARFRAEQEADADAYTRRKQAEVERFRAEQDAHASLEREQRGAEGEQARGEGAAAARRAIAEAQALEAREVGLAEAAAIEARGKAEAETRRLLAEAFAAYTDEGVTFEALQQLPQVAAAIAEPLSRAGETTIIAAGDESGTGAAKLAGDISSTATVVDRVVRNLTGVDLSRLAREVTGGGESTGGGGAVDRDR